MWTLNTFFITLVNILKTIFDCLEQGWANFLARGPDSEKDFDCEPG